MTDSEETRGERRIGDRTREEWERWVREPIFMVLGNELLALVDAAFSRDAEVEGSGEREVWCECCQRDHLLTAEGQKKGEG